MITRKEAKTFGTGWLVGMGVVALILATSTALLFATGTIQKWTADFRGDVKATEQTKANGSFRIATYEDFFALCSSVQSDEDAIRNAEKELGNEQTTNERAAKLRQNITAMENTRSEAIREYNSKAGQEHRAAFQDAELPERLDVNNYQTECQII